MTDYSYITRAMLGLNDLSSMRYTGSLAVGMSTTTAATGTKRLLVGDPSHVFMESSTVNLTVLELPGHDPTDGKLVDGLTFCIKNTTTKPNSQGTTYTIDVKQYINGASVTVATVYEQDAVTLTYSDHHDEWYITVTHNAW